MDSLFQTSMARGAIPSPCGLYRYRLTREWGEGPRVGFCLLNPSTADATKDDPTIRRCIGFARSWGAGSLLVVNLFAFRATDPAELLDATDPIGPENDEHLRRAADECGKLVAGWGVHGRLNGRASDVLDMLAGTFVCLGQTKDGHPKHPLYLPATARIEMD